jgi:hypothetical protein
MTDDGEYVLRRNDFRGRGNYMRQQRFSANLVQNFGVFGFQARPFARRHNNDGDARGAL